MDPYTRSSIFLTVAVLVAYVNHRFIRMQTTIAVMTASLLISVLLIIIQHFGIIDISDMTSSWIHRSEFQELLLKGMLSFLLFAGALTIDLNAFKRQKWEIGILASVSTIASTLLVGISIYYLLPLIGFQVPFIHCMLFGALISPTDPIAVLATFKQLGAPKNLQACIAGESLFNDGVGIVLFTTIFELAFQHHEISFASVSLLFLKQAVGGLAYGLLLGLFTSWLIKPISDSKIIILLTLGMVSGGYTFALWLGISGPLAMVMFGIIFGAKMRKYLTENEQDTVKTFWELIDEVLNAVLFLLIGFEIITINANWQHFVAIVMAIPLVLFVRLITVAIPMKAIEFKKKHAPRTIAILTWGGLRGGLALALAMSLPTSKNLDLLVSITYGIVAFSVIVQGLSVKYLTASPNKPATN